MQDPETTTVESPAPAAALLPNAPPPCGSDCDPRVGCGPSSTTAALALVAFIPMLASQPGVVSDDTKTYLYLDPGRYVRQAASLWDPSVGLGTVTHENIGYLLPMGPYFWVMAELHVPLWVAQRLWMGALLFAAGAGALFLCRTIGSERPGSLRGGTRLHVHALRAAVRRPHLGHPDALVGTALDDRVRHPRRPTPRLALPGTVRAGGRAGERHQRELCPLRRRRARALPPLRRAGHQGGDVAPGMGSGLENRLC